MREMLIKIGGVKYHALTVKKVIFLLILSTPLTFVLNFIQKYIYNDWDFLLSLGVLIVLDTVLGVAKAWKHDKVSSTGFAAIAIKILLYSSVLITAHVCTTFTIAGVHPSVLNWIDNFIFTSLIVREVISIFENVAAIQPNIVPAWALKKLEAFNSESGEFEGKESDKKAISDGQDKSK